MMVWSLSKVRAWSGVLVRDIDTSHTRRWALSKRNVGAMLRRQKAYSVRRYCAVPWLGS